MSRLRISRATPSATSSRGLAAGRSRSSSPAGRRVGRSGPDRAPASRSRARASAKAPKTPGTSGRRGSSSSASADLSASLGSRLQARLLSLGSTLYTLTWKERVTPSGRRISALRASALRTSDNVCSGWPTVVANDDNKTPEAHLAMKKRMGVRDGTGANRTAITSLQVMSQLAGWPTAQATERGQWNSRDRWMSLSKATQVLAGWPSPMAGTPAQKGYNAAGNNDSSRRTVVLTGWATPARRDYRFANAKPLKLRGGGKKGEQLCNQAVHFAGWQTPPARVNLEKSSAAAREACREHKEGMPSLTVQAHLPGPARLTASGQLLTGSSAGMVSGGQLSPEHSRWLMGYPVVWGSSGGTAMQSVRKLPRSSSRRTKT